MAKKQGKFTFMHFLLVVVVVQAVEAILVLVGILPPILTYSFGNIAFAVLKLGILVWCISSLHELGIKKNIMNGGLLGLAASLVVFLFSFVGKSRGIPVLGLQIPGGSYWFVMGLVVVENVILWVVIAAITYWITKKVKHK